MRARLHTLCFSTHREREEGRGINYLRRDHNRRETRGGGKSLALVHPKTRFTVEVSVRKVLSRTDETVPERNCETANSSSTDCYRSDSTVAGNLLYRFNSVSEIDRLQSLSRSQLILIITEGNPYMYSRALEVELEVHAAQLQFAFKDDVTLTHSDSL
eukprot:1563159-Rhodomonas_salina.3